ncbi:MAG: DNA methyltransferase [Planctomycetota bacterium]
MIGGGAILTGKFQDLVKELAPGSVDLVFCDPPYLGEHVRAGIYADLSAFASVVLKPGGLCMAYAGQFYVREATDGLASKLKYLWQCAILHTGGDSRFRNLNLDVGWKPVILCGKPPIRAWWNPLRDTISGGKEKSLHKWQQAEGEAAHFIAALCPPGGLVVDPCIGSGTTLAAAKRLGRRFWGCDCDAKAADTARRRLDGVSVGTASPVPCDSPPTAAPVPSDATDRPVTSRLHVCPTEAVAQRIRALGLAALQVNGDSTRWRDALPYCEVAILSESGDMALAVDFTRSLSDGGYTGGLRLVTPTGTPDLAQGTLQSLLEGPDWEVRLRLDTVFDGAIIEFRKSNVRKTPIYGA